MDGQVTLLIWVLLIVAGYLCGVRPLLRWRRTDRFYGVVYSAKRGAAMRNHPR